MPSGQFASVFGASSLSDPALGLTAKHSELSDDAADEESYDAARPAWTTLPEALGDESLLGAALEESWASNFQRENALLLLRDTVRRFRKVHDAVESRVADDAAFAKVLPDLHALFSNALPMQRLEDAVSYVLFLFACRIVTLEMELEKKLDANLPIESAYMPPDVAVLYQRLGEFVHGLDSVGLAGPIAQRAYAKAIDRFLDAFVQSEYGKLAKDEEKKFTVWELFKDMTEDICPFIKRFSDPMEELRAEVALLDRGDDESVVISWADLAVDKLGKIRARQLFDIIAGRDETYWAVEDLMEYTKTPAARRYLYEQFRNQLHERLLHPSASTVEVLEYFMLVIDVFEDIDHSGVLLHRAAEPIRAFLRGRQDTVKIIALSLLEKENDDDGVLRESGPTFCAPIAQLMTDTSVNEYRPYYEGIDLHNLNWTPDPVDAGFGHRGSRYLDKLAHVVLLESKESFLRELQSVLCERLLMSTDFDFAHELKLLGVFKARFEELLIQQCEVMLRDVVESQRLHEAISSSTPAGASAPDVHARVLSRFYWPALRNDEFDLAPALRDMAERYATEWARHKPGRRLEWLKSHGLVSVELSLADRTVRADATTWQASVIAAFSSDGGDDRPMRSPRAAAGGTQAATRTVAQLVQGLHMDEALVRDALAFWSGRNVLGALDPRDADAFSVLETLPQSTGPRAPSSSTAATASASPTTSSSAVAATAAAAAAVVPAALKPQSDTLADNAPVYASFVVGMLTNQGAMPAARVLAMLRMVVPGGFPFEEEQLVRFLTGLVAEGRIERAGALWKIKR